MGEILREELYLHFRNVYKQEADFLRGWAATFGAGRQVVRDSDDIGKKLKDNLLNGKWSNWRVHSYMMALTARAVDHAVKELGVSG